MFKNIFKHKILENNNQIINVTGLNKRVHSFYVWSLFHASNNNIIVVTNSLYDATNLYNDLSENANVYLFPMDDFIVSEALAISPDLMAKRIEVINDIILKNDKKIIITNLMGYLRFLPRKELFDNLFIKLKKGDIINREELIKKLLLAGYKKESIVTKTGEFANRGYILDIYAYDYEFPIRIEFFDDEIEEIRQFNPDTQISSLKKEEVFISPFTEFINEFSKEDIPQRQSLLPLVTSRVSNISGIFEPFHTIFIDLDNVKLSYEKILEQTIEYSLTDNFKLKKYMCDLYELIPKNYIDIISIDNYNKDNINETYFTQTIEKFNSNFEKLNNYIEKALLKKNKVIVCIEKKENIKFFEEKIKYKTILTNLNDIKDDLVNIVNIKMSNGFILNDEIYLTETEIFSSTFIKKYKSKLRYGVKIKDINKLIKGDYVVHADYGIGKYLGIVTLKSKNLIKDYLHIEYKNNDKLYVPVEKIELVYKYTSEDGKTPILSKLGGTDWIKHKTRVKGKVKEIAKNLLDLSAKRKLLKGYAYLEDDEEQLLFENKFEYTETADQLKSIEEIKKDMQLEYPMDRLLCGDVGYGKTEVAFRAIFKAIKSGKQAALLCPTTILSNQHYENALKRFSGFGVNIEVLNRFVTPKKQEIILREVESGKIDLIIGTHKLLNEKIKYKELGLLVIDEEQRFGVIHKEKIKELKNSIDVLTLSATPIPRTLQMSLSGLRGLSLIETPPIDRYPVQTYVLKENDQVIKDAIYKEIVRNGQVFILYNKVRNIEQQVEKISKLVPEASITYVHGQMTKSQIESTMEDFVSMKYNVLICTTIIETGIDIQNANTLIVIDADHFGLSQLYQIRGRVGRGKNIGYAYFMYNKNKELNEIAQKRLSAIKEFTELGSGYAIALRDLAIRGAGDILGSEQSGFIDTIGYDMYLRILNEEVARLKGEFIEEKQEEKPYLQVSTYIDDKYVTDEYLKIEIHKKINTIDSLESFEKVKEELEDRFGLLDVNILNYMKEELFQSLGQKKNIFKVEQLENKINILFIKQDMSEEQINNLYLRLYLIDKSFEVNKKNNILYISLPLKEKENYIDKLIKMLDYVE